MDCSLPGFSVHGILQARTLEWVATSFSGPALRQSNLNFMGWGLSVFFIFIFLTAPWVLSSLRYSHGWEPVWYTDSDNSGWEINFDESSLVACYQSRMLAIHWKLKMPQSDCIALQYQLFSRVTMFEQMATHSSILAWKVPWKEEPSWGHKELDTTERSSNNMHIIVRNLK